MRQFTICQTTSSMSSSQKRKLAESNATSKRVKPDLDGPNASLVTFVPQKENGLIKLTGPIRKVPDDAYVNPTAKNLFPQVVVPY